MPYFDRLEKRSPTSREIANFRELRAILGIAKSRAPILRWQLKSIAIDNIKSRSDLAKIPVLRAQQMTALQAEKPPFGGFLAARLTSLARIIPGDDLRLHPEGRAKDWWGAARALYAAGFRKDDLVLNVSGNSSDIALQILASGIHALGGVTVPVNPHLLQKLDGKIQPNGYIGNLRDTTAFFDGNDVQHVFRSAIITGTKHEHNAPPHVAALGDILRQIYLRPEIGVIAYQTSEPDKLICNEGVIVEIVEPNTSNPLALGQRGEIVITRLNGDYPRYLSDERWLKPLRAHQLSP
eukprot:gene7377-7440_t